MKSIYSKLIVGFIASIVISFSIAGYFAIRTYSNSLEKVAMEELRDSANSFVTIANSLIDSSRNDLEMHTTLEEFAKGNSTLFLLFALDGTFITYGNDLPIDEVSFDYLKELAKEKITSYQNSKNPMAMIENTSYSINRISNYIITSEVIEINGSVYVLILRKNMSEQEMIFKQTAFLAFIAIVFTGSVIFLIIADIIVKPITRITRATNEVIKGNYHVKVNYYGKDEIAKLNHSFNQMASQLAKTEEMRQQFISDISHEFQTPLTSIQGFAKILANENISEEQRKKYTDIIRFQSQRLSILSKNMLQLTLLDGEDLTLEKTTYSLIDQLNRVISTQNQEAKNKNIEIETVFPKKDLLIQADENQMEQVWINIINNAVKYTLEDGVVTIRVKRTSRDVEVYVEDTGVGMKEEATNHIFDRFYREDSSRTIQGNGLGLSIAKRIVELHRGSIIVTSQVDVGSVFKITLPIERESFISKYSKTIERENRINESDREEDT